MQFANPIAYTADKDVPVIVNLPPDDKPFLLLLTRTQLWSPVNKSNTHTP